MAGQNNSGYEAYYVPEQSKMAICATAGLFTALFGLATALNDIKFGQGTEDTHSWTIFYAGLVFFIGTLFVWFRTTIRENLAGKNSAQLKHSYAIGMQWFIFSEVMFFAVFFGALFYVRQLVGPWLGGETDAGRMNSLLWGDYTFSWPMMDTPQDSVGGPSGQVMANNGIYTGPERTMAFPGWANLLHWLPLWNTVILLSSSFTVHIAHLGLKEGNRKKLNLWLGITVLLGIAFVALQALEYHEAYVEYGLKLSSGIYGTTFFMLTGFHGFHVCMGMIMLLIQWLRATTANHFTPTDHFGFEASSWYWHFVDVVWVGLFLFVYIL